MQKKVAEHNQYKVDEEKFFLRVGLNTGLVIRKQNDIFGDVVNIASRMQAAANPGDVLLTHDTYAEIQNYVGCTPLGKIKVKGKEEAIAAYAAQEVKVDFNHLLEAVKTGAPAPRKGDGGRSGRELEGVHVHSGIRGPRNRCPRAAA